MPNAIRLPVDDPDLFKGFMQWLYAGHITQLESDPDDRLDQTVPMTLARSWTLGDKQGCPAFCQEALNELNRWCHDDGHRFPHKVAEYAFRKDVQSPQLRRLAVIQFIINTFYIIWEPDWIENLPEIDGFGTELVRVLPMMNRYLFLWCAKTGGFSVVEQEDYMQLMNILMERDPTDEEADSLRR